MKDIFTLVKNSENPLIEDAYCDFLDFNTKEQQTQNNLIKEIEHTIYTALCDYEDFGDDSNYSIKDIKDAKKLLDKMKRRSK